MKKIITSLLLASTVLISSCTKEDDLLTPVPNPPTTTQSVDTNNYTVTGNDSLVVCSWDTSTNNNTLDLEGSRYNVTYSSFYLDNRFPICAIPTDTTIFEESINSGTEEVYFTNGGEGYIRTKTYPIDYTEPLYNVVIMGYPHYFEQTIHRYEFNQDEIIIDVRQVSNNGNVFNYKITFDIISFTDNKLVIENSSKWEESPNHHIGFLGVDCTRKVRLELEKIN